jgi:hypothetical protein
MVKQYFLKVLFRGEGSIKNYLQALISKNKKNKKKRRYSRKSIIKTKQIQKLYRFEKR